jgi:hypothetical protein
MCAGKKVLDNGGRSTEMDEMVETGNGSLGLVGAKSPGWVWVGEVEIREPGKTREESKGVRFAPGVNIGEG